MRKVYKNSDGAFEQMIEDEVKSLRQNTSTDSSTISTGQAVCGPKYRKATWLLFVLNTFT